MPYKREGINDENLTGALCDIEEGLNDWEVNFVDSIDKWFQKHKALTELQRKKALEIWERFK